MPYENNKGADQHAHPRSLISAFVVYNNSSFYIQNFKPLTCFSVAAQAGLSLTYNNNNSNNNNFFQADNMFGTNASLAYGPQIQRHTCV